MNKVRRLILRTKREDTPMCPYCYAVADAKYVHYGSGDARTSPFFCNLCGAVYNADRNDDALSDEERKWSKPMIKVVELCHVHFPARKDTYFDGRVEPARTELRMTIWEPKDSTSQAIVTPGYAISVDGDYSIEYLLKTAQYKAYQGADKRLVCENDCYYYGNLESVTIDLKPTELLEYKMSAHLLGHYHGKPVWALFSPTGNCSACIQKIGYNESVVYNKETVERTLARCADADFFTSFLQDKLAKFEPK